VRDFRHVGLQCRHTHGGTHAQHGAFPGQLDAGYGRLGAANTFITGGIGALFAADLYRLLPSSYCAAFGTLTKKQPVMVGGL
jgi:hypothetical protein